MQVRQMLVNSSKYNIKCPYSMNATRIVVHNTANDASANNEISNMINNNNEVSFHIAVDDKEAVQGIPLNRNAWHAGDGNKGKGNREGIAIEICYSKSGGDRFIKAEQNAAKLIAQLLKERNWGIDKVTKHQDYSKKYCPHRTLDMGWERFLNMIRSELGEATVSATNTSNNNVTGDITYQSYDNMKKQWLPEVVNYNDYAGNFGNAMGGLRAKCKYGEVKIQVHTVGGGWLDYITSNNYKKNNKTDGNSYAGLYGKNIDGVRIKSTKGYVTYQAHLKGGSWLPEVDSRNADTGGANSYAGIYGKVIDGIRMK
ncbi:MAG: N-acetylmuramoyl-L-alanine amidase [Bacilli bacterium]